MTAPKDTWNRALRFGMTSGAVASLLSAAMLAALGKFENRAAAGPINGPSQWLWGRRAARRRAPSLRHTLAGYAIHHVTSSGWAIVHEKLFGPPRTTTLAEELGKGAVTAAMACVVDYRVTPKRLQPGFDTQLSRQSLALVYAAFALGLALTRRQRSDSALTHRVARGRD